MWRRIWSIVAVTMVTGWSMGFMQARGAVMRVTPAILGFEEDWEIPPGPLTPGQGGEGDGIRTTFGWSFRTLSTIRITELGYFDREGDGLTDPHMVGIWDEQGNLLASAAVPAGPGATLDGRYRYEAIPALSLPANQTFTIGGVTRFLDETQQGSDYGPRLVMPESLQMAADIVFVNSLWSGGATALWPPPGRLEYPFEGTLHITEGLVVNFRYVPEPGAAGVLGLGGMIALMARRRG